MTDYKINVYELLAICQILEYDKSVGFWMRGYGVLQTVGYGVSHYGQIMG